MAETTETKDTTVTSTEEKGKDTAGAGAGTSTTETPKAKTEEEIRAELQKEYEKMADKRVTDAIKKKEKEWADKAAKEKTIKGLRLDVVDAIAELGLDAGFRNLIAVEDLASISDEDERKKKLTERIKGMKSLFDAEVAKQVAKAKQEFLKGSTPETGSKKKDVTKYDEAKKAGNVSGMISEKMNAYRNREEE